MEEKAAAIRGNEPQISPLRYAPVEMTILLLDRVCVSKQAGNVTVHYITEMSSRPERTRISCHAALDIAACAAFVKESRMRIANATKLNRKSGVAQWRDLRFSLPRS